MALELRNIDQIVSDAGAVAQSISPQLTNLTEGSVFLALLYALGADSMVIQDALLMVMGHSRLATCTGVDVDTFLADFGLTRLEGVPATGNVTFSRISASLSTLITSDVRVKTGDGTQTFQVVTDVTHPNWDVSLQGYVLGSGVTSISVPVRALVAGTGGNVLANTVTSLATSLAGVDSITNSVGFTVSGAFPPSWVRLTFRLGPERLSSSRV